MNNTFDPFEEPRAPVRGNRNTVTGRPKASRFSPKTMFLAVMIAIGILFGAIWSLYPSGGSDDIYSQNVPIVRAESKPMKVIPEDAGGMDIPHRDSTVFSALRPEEEERPRIENLLADEDDEEPLPRSQLFAGLNTETEEDNKSTELVEIKRPERVIPFEETTEVVEEAPVVAEVVEPVVQQVEEKKVDPVPVQKAPEPVVKPAPVTKPAPKVEKKLNDVVSNVIGDAPKAETKKAAPVSSGSYYVQLASVKTRIAAESEWTKFKAKYNLSSAYRIQRKDLGEKGVFFRIQAGPYPKGDANSICANIKKKTPGGCLVTK